MGGNIFFPALGFRNAWDAPDGRGQLASVNTGIRYITIGPRTTIYARSLTGGSSSLSVETGWLKSDALPLFPTLY